MATSDASQSPSSKIIEEEEMEVDVIPETANVVTTLEDAEDGEVDEEGRDGVRARLQTSDRTGPNQDTLLSTVDVPLAAPLLNQEKRYVNKAGSGFVTGVDVFSPEEQAKLTHRADRFRLDPSTTKSLTAQELSKIYESVGVKEGDETHRLRALHMQGTDELSTEDIFTYFKAYGPASIEWINDSSCNVVWLDEVSAARALIGLSQEVETSTGESCTTNDTSDQIPDKMRVGVQHPKAKNIRLRFASTLDKKSIKSERSSDYYKKHGNPNFGGMKGLLSESHKRRYRREEVRGGDVTKERTRKSPDTRELQSRSRLPRMRMYADDEEVKIEKRKSQMSDLRGRLQRDRVEVDSDSDEEPMPSKKFCGDLRSKLNSRQKKLGIELDHERYYDIIASE